MGIQHHLLVVAPYRETPGCIDKLQRSRAIRPAIDQIPHGKQTIP